MEITLLRRGGMRPLQPRNATKEAMMSRKRENENKVTEKSDLCKAKTIPKEKPMSNKVNLLDVAATESMGPTLDIVKLSRNEIPIIPFTSDSEKVDLHYCSETEISSYVVCNGSDCVLCRIGRKLDQRLLLPVYLPASGCVSILPVSPSLRPFALLPQIANVLKAEKPLVMFVTREGAKYTVSSFEVQKDVDSGEAAIKRFLDDYEAGIHDLSTIFPKINNEQLANVEKIDRMMTLKGVRRDADDKRS